MQVFVAGATGVLGKRVVPLLVEAGHEVTAVARSEEKSEILKNAGARPQKVDLFDAADTIVATKGCDAIINIATHIPIPKDRAKPGSWAENTRVRTDISKNVADAAQANEIPRLVQESIWLVYPDHGSEWVDESSELKAAPLTKASLVAESNALALNDDGHEAVALRFAQFYAPDSNQLVEQVNQIRKGKIGVFGKAGAYLAQLDLDDAATAVIKALSVPPGAYNVADNNPATRAEYVEAMTTALGAEPIKYPRFQPILMVGDQRLGGVQRSLRISNEKFKAASGWQPSWAKSVDGIAATLARL